ncbi:hypothetical protein FHR90_003334 [Endobacter medicaginis]|uniref:Terminase n=1 Tax=Endobacter medicaginis TaxID=1181271 RepID=A0A850NLN0_9PROT|nr:terminase family protein [Endobacter medicaginis]MBB3175478.1 hypothetical protein [Endobacter medicaginis]MCX5477131.1 hypothetical protein [Endobacter medicaginis]NVN29814.1 terminase [Endobacter medicaginis]
MATRSNRRSTRPDFRPTLSRPQGTVYRAGWQPDARFRTIVAGRRWGKTFLICEEMRRAAREAVRRNIPTENEIWYGAPTLKQAKRVFWKRLKRAVPESWMAAKPNESECSITLISGHVIRIVGMAEYDNLRGSGLWFFAGDEWQDAPEAAWAETIRPMLSTANGHAIFIGTPKGFNHLRDWYIKGQPGGEPDCRSFSYTTLQGGNVPADEVEQARRTLDARSFRQEYEASFETYEGRVLHAFSRADSVRPCRGKLTSTAPLILGIDFNINPMSCVCLVEEGGTLFQVDEIVLPTANTDDLVAEIRSRYARNGSLAHITAYPDPAGAQRRTSAGGRTDIGILQASGMRVIAMSSHPQVRDRNNITNARFATADSVRRLFVDPGCRKSIESYERHVYREGSSEPDKSTGYDHLPDALGYACYGKYAYKPPAQQHINVFGR